MISTSTAIAAGYLLRQRARKHVKEQYEAGAYDELQDLKERAHAYQDDYFEGVYEDGLYTAIAQKHVPPNRDTLRFWKHVGYAQGFQDIDLDEIALNETEEDGTEIDSQESNAF